MIRPAALPFAVLAALLLGGGALRAINLGTPALCCDEFFDVFAGRSWLEGEGFQIPGREYTRALVMTRLTGVSFAVFGESEWSARVPSLLLGLATLPLVFMAGRLWFGPVAGIVALALTVVSIHAIDTSRFARLYSLLTLLLLACAVAVYRGMEGSQHEGPRWSSERLLWFLAAAAAAGIALTLHPVSLSIAVGVQVYVTLLAIVRARQGERAQARMYALFAVAFVVLEVIAFSLPAFRDRLLRAALEPLPWYNPRPGDDWVHHEHLAATYGWLWYMVLPATCVAVYHRLRSGLFLACLFWLPFLFVSIVVATKHPRYTVQLLPFAWLILAGAADAVLSRPDVRAKANAMLRHLRRRPLLAVPAGLAALLVLYAAAEVTPSVRAAARRPWQETGRFTTGSFYDWRSAARELGPVMPDEALVVSDLWHECVYYLGREAYQLLAGYRQMSAGDWEMPERDYSTKVQTREQLEGLRHQRPVWIVASRERWTAGRFFDAQLTGYVEETCNRVPAPSTARFAVVFDCASASAPQDGP